MFVIIGSIVVIGGVLGGYVAHHGNLAVLWQPTELVIIGGAAFGSMLISNPLSVVKMAIAQVLGTLKKGEPTKAQYLEVLMCMYELLKIGKANMLGLEPHVEKPEESEVFKRYPGVLHNHHLLHFITDTLRMQVSSPVSPYDLEDLMNADIDAAHNEELKGPDAINYVGDAMPGLGIVAAVLGVVITMGKLDQGKTVIGQSVAGALVGTFLGILASYGFLGPLSKKMTAIINQEGSFLHVAKGAILAFAKDLNPKVCVEFARRTVPPVARPDAHEFEQELGKIGKAA